MIEKMGIATIHASSSTEGLRSLEALSCFRASSWPANYRSASLRCPHPALRATFSQSEILADARASAISPRSGALTPLARSGVRASNRQHAPRKRVLTPLAREAGEGVAH